MVVTGAGGPLGRRVCARAAADPAVGRVVALGAEPGPGPLPTGVEVSSLGLADPELPRLLEGADVVVHLGPTTGPDLDGTGGSEVDLVGARRLLTAAGVAGATRLVVLSSAMAYGAWPNNPVPLTEDAPLRPDPGLPYAVAKAELERLAGEWRVEHPGARVAVLRPAIAVAAEQAEWLAKAPWSTAGVQLADAEAPLQFVHLDDLAAAIDLARRDGLDGAFNVAPDSWLTVEARRDLEGPSPRLRLPEPFGSRAAAVGFRAGLRRVPPEVLAYTVHPWAVANDRLRAAGWSPRYTNEEAYVEAGVAGPIARLSPRHRQELSLAVAGGVIAAAATGVVLALRRHRRRS